MGVNILSFSNHKIRNVKFKDRISEFERIMEVCVKFYENTPRKKYNVPNTTQNLNDIEFYICGKNPKKWFNQFDEIEIETNYKYLFSIRLFRQTMMISPSGFNDKHWYWIENLQNKDSELNRTNEKLNYEKHWNKWISINNQIVRKLGGDCSIIIDEISFQTPENLFYEGESMLNVILELEKVGKMYPIEMLYANYELIEDIHPSFFLIKQ